MIRCENEFKKISSNDQSEYTKLKQQIKKDIKQQPLDDNSLSIKYKERPDNF